MQKAAEYHMVTGRFCGYAMFIKIPYLKKVPRSIYM